MGRKKIFTEKDKMKMLNMIKNEYKISDVAKKFNTSRQVIGRYINSNNSQNGYNMRFRYMNKNKVCTIIDINDKEKKIKIQNRTNNNLDKAFGINENPDYKDFQNFLEDRCFPKERFNKKELLNDLGLEYYDPILIIEKTHGIIDGDKHWIDIINYKKREEKNKLKKQLLA